MSYSTGARIVTDGLVYYVDAANPKSAVSGSNVWRDLMGNENLVANNLTTTRYISGTTASFQFSALTDYTDFFNKSISSGSVLQASASYTLEAFAAPASSSNGDGTYSLFRVGTGADAIFMFGIVCNSVTGLVTSFSTQWYAGNFRSAGSSAISVPFGSFNHYAITNAFGLYKFYLNGVLLSTTDLVASAYPYASVTAADARIGGSGSGLQDFSGKIGSVRLYRRALSDAEIMRNYAATKGRFRL